MVRARDPSLTPIGIIAFIFSHFFSPFLRFVSLRRHSAHLLGRLSGSGRVFACQICATRKRHNRQSANSARIIWKLKRIENSFSHSRKSRLPMPKRCGHTHSTQCADILIFRLFFFFPFRIGVWKWCCRQTCGSISCGTLSKLFRVNSCTSADTGSWFMDAYISWWFASVWKRIFITGSGIDWKFKK